MIPSNGACLSFRATPTLLTTTAVVLSLCMSGCMATSTRLEPAGPTTTVASRTGPLLGTPPRARVTFTPAANGMEARVEALRSCSSELLRRTPRVEIRESSPRPGGVVTLSLLAAVGVLAAARSPNGKDAATFGAVLVLPAAIGSGLLYSASGEERIPAPPATEQVHGPNIICDVQPWPGALLSIRTSQGIEDSYADKTGIVRLKGSERPQSTLVNGAVVEDTVWTR